MEELRALGDRVTVLRDGETVFHGAMGEVSTDELIRYMVGRSFEAIYHRDPLPAGEALLRVRNLTRPGSFEDVSFDVRAGEIVGLAGLMGAGRTELCSALFGVAPAHAGEIHVGGVPAYIQSPRDAVKAGLALIPEDRGRAGLATALPVKHNLTLASLARFCSTGVVRRGAELDAVRRQVSRFQLKCGSPEQRSGTLSGGNQQKVVVAKWGLREPRVFLFDEPTRGIDIGAKAEVFHLMDELARSGAAILMVSSELPELTQVADRILIMRRGRLVAEKPRDATQEEIMRHAALE
jgi:ABC-type sugar transport system ATPase subunit